MNKKIKKALKFFYDGTGRLICFLHHTLNDRKRIDTDTVLVVAHPDDDTLFFHTVLKEKHPFVVLMTTGASLIRMREFRKAMKYYGVGYTCFCVHSRATGEPKLKTNLEKALRRGEFKTCYTHGADGEYGHVMHKRVHELVFEAFQNEIFTAVNPEKLKNAPELEKEIRDEKEMIFKKIYKTQSFALEMWSDYVGREAFEKVK